MHRARGRRSIIPHIFCDMGDDTEIICAYCSTLYRLRSCARPACGAAGRMRLDRDHGRLTSLSRHAVAASRTILIAGAGIGGLSRRQGARPTRASASSSAEQAERLAEAGAGIQLSPERHARI